MPYAHTPHARLYFEMTGSGSPVLLSPGLGGSAHYWEPQREALARSHTVIVYDHAGTGRSAPAVSACTGMEEMAGDALAVLDAAGVAQAHFVGHAIGGNIGLAMALSAPRRLSSLCMVNGWACADAYLRRCFEVRVGILKHQGALAFARAQPLFLFPPEWISDHAPALDAASEQQAAHLPPAEIVLARIEAALAFDARQRLAQVSVPTLVSCSTDDHLVPVRLSHELAAGIPGALLDEVPWGAHASSATVPGPFNERLLAFLAKVEALRA